MDNLHSVMDGRWQEAQCFLVSGEEERLTGFLPGSGNAHEVKIEDFEMKPEVCQFIFRFSKAEFWVFFVFCFFKLPRRDVASPLFLLTLSSFLGVHKKALCAHRLNISWLGIHRSRWIAGKCPGCCVFVEQSIFRRRGGASWPCMEGE